MKTLKIAEGLSLPLETVTESIGILAKRRAGKSYTARRFAEQLFKAGQQVVILDPKGDWWGIRSSADGKSPGLPIIIIGGERGDVPLEHTAGEVVAKLIVEDRVSALIDLSLLRKEQRAYFAAIFLETLYRLKAREIYRTPLMLIVDEADAIAPQKPQKGEERMLGAAEDIVRRGGQRGIGCTLVTQRSAVINKDVLTQVQIMVALRTIAPQDLKAMNLWIDVHGSEKERGDLMASLPSLPQGNAWFWSPGWPTAGGIFQRVKVLPIETFDSGATPKSGEKRIEPKHLADVDLDVLKKQMADTIERAKQDNPTELKKIIAAQKKQIADLTRNAPQREQDARRIAALEEQVRTAKPTGKPKVIEKRIMVVQAINRLEGLSDRLDEIVKAYGPAMSELRTAIREGKELNAQNFTPAPAAVRSVPPPPENPGARLAREIVRAETGGAPSDAPDQLSAAEQKILDELAELEAVGITPVVKSQLAFFCGYANPKSGGFSEPAGRLNKWNLVSYPRAGHVALTDAGRARAKPVGQPRTTEDLQRQVVEKVDPAMGKIVRRLIEIHPDKISKKDLATELNYANPKSGGFSEPMGRLRAVGLVEYPEPSFVKAGKLLFLE